MKRISLLIATLACVAYGDEATKTAKVEEYLKLMKVDVNIQQMKDVVRKQMQTSATQQLSGVKQSPQQEQAFKEYLDKTNTLIFDTLTWEKMRPEYVKIYSDAFTEKELDDMIAFYKSPSGQAMVDKTPALTEKTIAIAQKRMLEVMPQLQKLMQDYRTQLKQSAQPEEDKK